MPSNGSIGAIPEEFLTPKPVAIGLLLGDRVIVDKDANSPSAIGIFSGLAVERFPSESQRFSALAVVTDAQGSIEKGSLMRTGQEFDYALPTCATLAGIYVEASDQIAAGSANIVGGAQMTPITHALPRREDLFGLTLTVDDGTAEEPTNRVVPRSPTSHCESQEYLA
jgi:hypothetical protein